MNNLDRDIVLFLGAGFSFNAGLPKMAEFGSEAKLDHEGLKKHNNPNDNFRNAVPLLISAAETFEGFQKLLLQKNVLNQKEINNMETLFCIAESLYESGIKILEINGNLKGIETLIEEIKLWLWKVYQQYPPLNAKRRDGVEEKVLDDFFKIIKDAKIQNKITVLSTNYDLVYEYCSWKNKISCAYPLSWDTDFKAGHGDNHFISQYEDTKGKTLVCKLHGSVNFFYKLSENHDKLSIASDLGNEREIGKSGSWNDLPAIFAVDSIWNIRNKYGNGYVPAIIPPTYAKLRGYPWLQEIWKVAFESVKNAKKIIFIGYSFQKSDGFIKAFFQGALAMRENNSKLDIHLIDPKEEVHNRFEDIFKSLYRGSEYLFLKDAINKGIIKDLFQI